jgi:hypothetical protein
LDTPSVSITLGTLVLLFLAFAIGYLRGREKHDIKELDTAIDLARFRSELMQTKSKLMTTESQLDELRVAVSAHAMASWGERCYFNDLDLYRRTGITNSRIQTELPPLPEFMRVCAEYWQMSQGTDDSGGE